MKRAIKGTYGYLRTKRVHVILRTILFFAVSLSLFAAGIITTHTRRNLLTVVAVLGCLPACKSLVGVIMYLRASGCGEKAYREISKAEGRLVGMYDMYFTSYQKNYPLSHMALKGSMLCGITEHPSCDCREAEKHLEQMLVQEGIKNVTVNIFSQEDKYIDRLGRMIEMHVEDHKDRAGIINLLYSVSI